MSASNLDPVIHTPKRLMVMAILANSTYATFQFLKEQLALTDSDLSKQMSTLESAGYITTSKHGRGPGATTRYAMTRHGDQSYRAHRAALYAILAPSPATPEGASPHDHGPEAPRPPKP